MHAGICHVVVIGCMLISVQLPSSGPGHNSRDDKNGVFPVTLWPMPMWAHIMAGGGGSHADWPLSQTSKFNNIARPRMGANNKTGGEYYATTLGPLFRFRYDSNPWHLVVEEKKRRKGEGSKPTEPR